MDYDVLISRYLLDTTPFNQLKMDTLDLINRRVAGQFEVHLIRENTSPDALKELETIHFFNQTTE